jgi:tetratricopeptide (TPR) repeat protein
MRIKILFLLLTAVLALTSFAFCMDRDEARSLFYQGNTHYSEEKFDLAIADYEKILAQGIEGGPLYYNLGNAYFKSGSLGKAILNYIRAKRFMPNDADLKSNLKYAQSLIKGGTVAAQRNWFQRLFFGIAGSFSLNGITLFSSVLYFLFCISVGLLILSKNFKKPLAAICAAVFAFFILSSAIFLNRFYDQFYVREAVVIMESVDSKFEPLDNATTYFSLSEGEIVYVLQSKLYWVKIRRSDNKQGWVKKQYIDLVG